jgi:SAM-dependent methyltransferase
VDDLRRQTRDGYDVVASDYARLLPDTRYEAAPDLAMVDHFVTGLVATSATARVLDAGCGTGRMMGRLQALGPSLEVVGADLSSAMVSQARAAHPARQIDVADLNDLPYDGASFDGVLAWYSIIHTPPHALGPVLRELARVLRPGGQLLLGYQAGTGDRRLDRPYGHDVELHAFLHHTPYVRSALESAGLAVATVLDRGARPGEPYAQGFVIATRG